MLCGKYLRVLSGYIRQVPFRAVGIAFGENIPDIGQEHPANGDNGLFVAPVSLDSAIVFFAFRVFIGFDNRISNLHKERFQVGPGARNAGRLHFPCTLIVAGATPSPGNQIFSRREHGHIDANFREDCDGGHWVSRDTRHSTD